MSEPNAPTDLAPRLTPGAHATLPQDLLELAARRLGIAALVWAGLWSLTLLMNNVVGPLISPGQPLDDAWPLPGNPVAVAVVALSIGLFAYTRWHACDCRLLLDIGLVYEITLALAIGVVNQWTPNTAGLSWICVLVLVHPMIVPHTRGRTLAAALVAASMDPVGLGLTAARGVALPPFQVLLWTNLPNYICAVLSVVPSHVITRLGSEVSDARELGSYQLGELLGRGGMGEVYSARHRLLRRPAAIKLIRPRTLAAAEVEPPETIVRRFKREAEAAASLHSPHTIALYDFGVTREGDLYYVMELLYGVDLDSLVERFGPVAPARSAFLIRQACHSLAEAHASGFVHRDVKPGNLYACRVGLEADFVKVLDFGLVKGVPGPGVEQTKLTAPGIATGTPAFMAPELARGEEADPRADVYSLGCVLYWLLTGQLVFDADSPMKMMLAHIGREPIPASARSGFRIEPALDELLLACLEKEPDRRPADAGALAARLDACDHGDTWSREKAAQWWRMNLPGVGPPLEAPRTSIGAPAG